MQKKKQTKQTKKSNSNKETQTDKCLYVNKPMDNRVRKHIKGIRQRRVQWHPWSSDCDTGGSTGDTDRYRGSPDMKKLHVGRRNKCQNKFFQSSRAFLVFLETVFYSCSCQKINVENPSNLPVLLKEIKHDNYFYLLLGTHCEETIWIAWIKEEAVSHKFTLNSG